MTTFDLNLLPEPLPEPEPQPEPSSGIPVVEVVEVFGVLIALGAFMFVFFCYRLYLLRGTCC